MLNTMEKLNSYKSTLQFRDTEADPPRLELNIKWQDMSHVLVSISDRLGQLKRLVLFERSEVNALVWSGFSNSQQFFIQVYGLKESTPTNPAQHPPATVYSVEAGEKVVLSCVSGFQVFFTERVDVDLRGGQHYSSRDKLTDILKTEGELLMEVEEKPHLDPETGDKPPVDYILKPTVSSRRAAHMCVVLCERNKKEYVVMSSADNTCIPLLPVCESRTNYKVKAIKIKDCQAYSFDQPSPVCYLYKPHKSTQILPIKTCMSKVELQQLKAMAVNFCRINSRRPGKYNITQFYRNEPEDYYTNIMSNRGGVMEKYIKDNNGDPYSAINHNINGLFFSGSLDTRTKNPPDFSYFGDTRLFIPAEELFTPDTRMYFADFFCHNKVHYVTAVVTKRGSSEDRFCDERLIELDLKDNPFFTIKEHTEGATHHLGHLAGLSSSFQSLSVSHGYAASTLRHPSPYHVPSHQNVVRKTFRMVSVNKFHVEFLYTEDVDIKGLIRRCGEGNVYFKQVRGLGVSKADGIPKNPNCPICNLPPKA
ncbi:uncharacterized protein LOC124267267 isoform X1 [Haliotis rubra]|uniref:uncharacterized protein LOC124267267 isoform X1 n=1 Tax=Haliotis rubra TaxID=36100 RepID=UPI001EE5ADED|nr:uncharacterized protein LOC124267267 isoform X1 [Haliotis rubra]